MSSCHLLVRLDGILYGEDADVCDCVRVGIGCPVSSLVQWSASLGVYELSKYRRAELLVNRVTGHLPPPKKKRQPQPPGPSENHHRGYLPLDRVTV